MSIDKMRLNGTSRRQISICATIKTLVQIMDPLRIGVRNFLRKAFSDKYLLATNMIIAFALCTLADIFEQQIEHYNKITNSRNVSSTETFHWDFIRTRNMGLSGCLVEFICHYWYQFLDRRMPEHTLSVVFKKIALDQFLCAPIYLTAFFTMLGLLENESVQEIWNDVKTKAVRVYMIEWIIWPPAQFLNFYYISPKYRVAYDSFVSFGFDIYTSRVKHFEEENNIENYGGETSVLMNKLQRSLFSEQGT